VDPIFGSIGMLLGFVRGLLGGQILVRLGFLLEGRWCCRLRLFVVFVVVEDVVAGCGMEDVVEERNSAALVLLLLVWQMMMWKMIMTLPSGADF